MSDRIASLPFPHEKTRTRNIKKRHVFPHSTVAATRFGARNAEKPNRKKIENKQKTEMPMACLPTPHHIPSPASANSVRPPPQPRTCTHIIFDIFKGAGIQQQPHAVRVTILSGIKQRRVSALRRRRPSMQPTCVSPSAAVKQCTLAKRTHTSSDLEMMKKSENLVKK